MKKTLIILLSLITFISCSQKLKKVHNKLNHGIETYTVSESNPELKHGAYKLSSNTHSNTKLEQGEYISGKKEGEWITWYNQPGNLIKTQGKYLNDVKVGVWSYFKSNGDLIQKYDFDKNEIVENPACNSDNKYLVKKAGEIIDVKLDCPPTRIGGLENFRNKLSLEIFKKNPFENGRRNVNINETLSFYINEEGNIEEIDYTGKNEKINDLIIEFLNKTNNQWIPGVLNGQKVNAKIEIPIILKIY